jgi:hypothetical protein
MDVGTQVAVAAIISFLVGKLKQSSWFPWLTAETSKLNRLVAVLLSGVAAVGIHYQWDAADHSLLITGLSLTTILGMLWHWAVQAIYTHGWFKATNGDLLDTLKQILSLLQVAQPQQQTNVAAGGK